MCRSSSGFEISETDLKLRGPGDLMGTRQSGLADLKLTNLAEDGHLLEKVRNWVREFLLLDPDLKSDENQILKTHLEVILKVKAYWNEIA
jgi:ATP-dependent DNA helicase RecG